MLIDTAASKVLFGIILMSTQGVDRLEAQLPLQVLDRGESWLIKGTPYTDKRIHAQYIANYIIIKKNTAEVIGIGSDARMIPNEEEKKTLSPADYDRIFGPRTRFEPGGEAFARHMLMNKALYGGLINKPADAIAYAHALMQTTPRWAKIPASALQAVEQARIWHVTTISKGAAAPTEIMSFSRETGKVLSGDL